MSLFLPRIGEYTVHSIAMKLSPVVVNLLAVVLEIKKKIYINCTSWSTRCFTFPIGARTVRPNAIKLAQVILNMLGVVLEIVKI